MKDTLCWNCKNTCGGCSWTKDFVPVENWKAIPTRLKIMDKYDSSFVVLECPKFQEIYPFNMQDRKYPYYRLYKKFHPILAQEEKKLFYIWLKYDNVEACRILNMTDLELYRNIYQIKKKLKRCYQESLTQGGEYGIKCAKSGR